jgi:hypothetical protein
MKEKVAGLPVWAWALLAAGGIALWWWKSKSSSSSSANNALSTSAAPVVPAGSYGSQGQGWNGQDLASLLSSLVGSPAPTTGSTVPGTTTSTAPSTSTIDTSSPLITSGDVSVAGAQQAESEFQSTLSQLANIGTGNPSGGGYGYGNVPIGTNGSIGEISFSNGQTAWFSSPQGLANVYAAQEPQQPSIAKAFGPNGP